MVLRTMLFEQAGGIAIVTGIACLALTLIAGLFMTNFPATGRIRQLGAYRILAGSFFIVAAATVTAFVATFIIVAFNLSSG